jgi:nucleoid-associated protein YgaU
MRHGCFALVLLAAALMLPAGCQDKSKDPQLTLDDPDAARDARPDGEPEVRDLDSLSPPPAAADEPGEEGRFAAEPREQPLIRVVEPVEPAPPAEPKRRMHVVQPGDTYFSLAKRYLGDGRRWREIQDLNGYPPSRIPVGAELEIPAEGSR